MDQIDYSISINRHITKNPRLIKNTWEDFYNVAQNRKVILYGISEIFNFLWLRCDTAISIVAAIDNDSGKQNLSLGTFFDENDLGDAKDIKISPKSAIKSYSPDEVVILISSLRYYDEIAAELETMGFYCYFSVLNLEYYYRNINSNFETLDSYKTRYAKECTEKYPIENNKIVCYGFGGYADHEKYITEALLKMNKNLHLIWIVKKFPVDVPEGVEVVFNGNFKRYIREMETAKIWIFDVPIEMNLIKREEQIYIQTKHWGSITLKKFYLDTPLVSQVKDNEYFWKLNGKWMDYIISGSEFDEKSCRSGFNFKGKFLRFGSPRSDAMFEPDRYKSKIYKHFNLNPEDHILLYAPTFRFRNAKEGDIEVVPQDFLNFEMLMSSLKVRWPLSWKILLRLHPHLRTQAKRLKKPDFVIDVTDYDDNQELAAAADIMISDYSSFMFEPAYVLKPVFLYAPDKDEYVKNERELLLDYDSLPFPISTNDEELATQIEKFDEEAYNQDVKKFLASYNVCEDGHASQRAAQFILDLITRGEAHA